VKIRKVQVASFGRFQSLSLEFGDGLNVIYGPNETGKTTLMRFIQGMLFGLQKPGAARRQPLPELERLSPWDGSSPRGVLLYRLDSGATFRVERDFGDKGFIRLYDAATGQELTSRFRQDRRKELLFAEEQLGLTDAMFSATACIGQMEAGKLGLTHDLTARLANLAGGGQEDVSISGVIKLLDQEMAKIGHPDRDSGKPLAQAVRRVASLDSQLQRACQVRDENLGNEARLRHLRLEEQELAAREAEAGRNLASRRRQDLTERLQRLRDLRQALTEAEAKVASLQAWQGFPADQRDEVAALAEALSRLAREGRESQSALESLRRRRSEAEGTLAAFQPLQSLDPDLEAQVTRDFGAYSAAQDDARDRETRLQKLAADREALKSRLAAFGPLAERGVEWETRLEELDDRLRQSETEQVRLAQARPEAAERLRLAEVARNSRGRTAALVSGLTALLGLGLAVVLRQPLVALTAVAAFPLWLLLKRPPGSALQAAREAALALETLEGQAQQAAEQAAGLRAEREGLLQGAAVTGTAELKARNRECQRLLQESQSLERDLERLETDRRNIARALQVTGGALAEAVDAAQQVAAALPQGAASAAAAAVPGEGAPTAGIGRPDPQAIQEEHIRQFRQVWAAHSRTRLALEDLDRQIQQVQSRLAAQQTELSSLQTRLDGVLRAAGVATPDEFRRAYQSYQSYREAESARRTAEEVLRQALAEGDEASLEQALGEIEEPSRPEEPVSGDPSDLARRLDALRAERSRKQAEVRGLEERIEQAYRDLPDVASLQAELEEARIARQGLDDRRWVLEQARSEVEAASEEVHREFAPRLNEAASAAIAAITGGRYREVRVDARLGLRAVVPENGELHAAEDLSGGTLDQFYLALRLGMARLLTGGGETVPFLLDDTFVQFDDQRLMRAMGHLVELSRTSQVLLFSCHQREVEAARRYPSGARIIELPEPVSR